MKTSNKTLLVLLLAALPGLMGLQCGESITRDPEFQLWCGDKLCQWSIDQGMIRKVPTWDRNDYGVELVGDAAEISQTSNISNLDATCIQFDMVASVADTATARLQMDFLADGDVECEQVIPTSDWAPLRYRVKTPTGFWKIRFMLRKEGPGRAVLARIRATASSDCTGPPLPLNNRPDGIGCADGTECHSGQCVQGVCGDCSVSSCATGQVCGLSSGGLSLYPTCVAPGVHSLGERCQVDGECSTGICCRGVCSTCCDGIGCSSGGNCQPDFDPSRSFTSAWAPYVCFPWQHRGASMAPCFYDDDCASRHCIGGGSLKQCPDGRLCMSNGDCPVDPFIEGCVQTGVAHGLCQ